MNAELELKDHKNMSEQERINLIMQDWFVLYPRAIKILDKLEMLLNLPDTIRPPSFLLVGEPNNGKTSLAYYFLSQHESYEEPDGLKIPALLVQAPSKPKFDTFLTSLLTVMGIPFRHTEPESEKYQKVIYYAQALEVKLLFVDEIHNILSGTTARQREFMNGLKNLVNDLKRPVVLIGTKDALYAVNTDYQIQSRFRPEVLPLWNYDEEYLALLNALESVLPLKKESRIAQNEKLSRKILEYSEGKLGEIVSLVRELAILAIRTGREKIDLELLREVDWTPPSVRTDIGRNLEKMIGPVRKETAEK